MLKLDATLFKNIGLHYSGSGCWVAVAAVQWYMWKNGWASQSVRGCVRKVSVGVPEISSGCVAEGVRVAEKSSDKLFGGNFSEGWPCGKITDLSAAGIICRLPKITAGISGLRIGVFWILSEERMQNPLNDFCWEPLNEHHSLVGIRPKTGSSLRLKNRLGLIVKN